MLNMICAAAAALAIGFYGGWEVRSWYDSDTINKCEQRHAARDLDDANAADKHHQAEAEANRNAAAALAARQKTNDERSRERESYLSSFANDAACRIPGDLVRLHDATAQAMRIPRPAGLSDGATGSASCRAVVTTTAENYDTCHDTADRLTDLQTWLRDVRR
jgi:hypothetical protein